MVDKKMYKIVYWLPGQSKLFSEPQFCVTSIKDDFIRCLNVCKEHGYEIEYKTELEDEECHS